MECVQKSETERKRTTTLLNDDYDDNTGEEVEPPRCSLMLIGSLWDDDTVSKANKELVDPETGLTDEERDQRSVCVSGIPLRATRKEVDKFFSSVCKVRNIELIVDPNSRVPKAMGYCLGLNLAYVLPARAPYRPILGVTWASVGSYNCFHR